jgi:hypothetical protein
MSKFTSKTIIRVHSDEDYYFEIGGDADGLGNIEIRYFEKQKDGDYEQLKRIAFDPACIDKIVAGLCAVQQQLKGE